MLVDLYIDNFEWDPILIIDLKSMFIFRFIYNNLLDEFKFSVADPTLLQN